MLFASPKNLNRERINREIFKINKLRAINVTKICNLVILILLLNANSFQASMSILNFQIKFPWHSYGHILNYQLIKNFYVNYTLTMFWGNLINYQIRPIRPKNIRTNIFNDNIYSKNMFRIVSRSKICWKWLSRKQLTSRIVVRIA